MWFTHNDKFATRRNLPHNIPTKYPHPNTTYPVFDESRKWTIVAYSVAKHFLLFSLMLVHW
jgi:hypothetical protein